MGRQRREERQRRKTEARKRIRRILWQIYIRGEERERLRELVMPTPGEWVGPVERWADEVHYEGEGERRVNHAMTTRLGDRVGHATKCLITYVAAVMRPAVSEREREELQLKRVAGAKRRICAILVREYKQKKQQQLLDERARARGGLVCANTRNVSRLAPKGGVRYDETRRYRARIQVGDVYTLKRWPRRDKCGPTLVKVLV